MSMEPEHHVEGEESCPTCDGSGAVLRIVTGTFEYGAVYADEFACETCGGTRVVPR